MYEIIHLSIFFNIILTPAAIPLKIILRIDNIIQNQDANQLCVMSIV